MEVKPEAPNSAPVVKNENQNPQGNNKQIQGGGPSGNNKFNNQGGVGNRNNNNNPNLRQNKNFQPKGNRNMPMQMGMRGPPKGEVSEKRDSAIFLSLQFFFFLIFITQFVNYVTLLFHHYNLISLGFSCQSEIEKFGWANA